MKRPKRCSSQYRCLIGLTIIRQSYQVVSNSVLPWQALITNPVTIADEPTGNLDFESGEQLMTLQQYNKKPVKPSSWSHDLVYLKYADRGIRLFDGMVQDNFNIDEKFDYRKYAVKTPQYVS